MAKKSEKEGVSVKGVDMKNMFKELDNLNPDGALLSESALSQVDDWIDTGSYALNAILSGSCYKGTQCGRIFGLCGPSGCGKTLMAMKVVGNFQRKSPDNWAIVFDSEIAVDKQTALGLGADPTRIRHYPINTVKETRNQILKALNIIIENGLHGKFVILIDSLGNLAGDKEVTDAENDKTASDMGTRAKDIKSLLRVLTYRAAKAKTTIIFTNHIYSDPMAMYESAIKQQSGGEGPVYMASSVLQLGFKREKNENEFKDEEIISIAKKVGGITMHALTVKNRFIPQMLETDLYLNFKTGLDKYSGLFEIAKGLGVITGDKTYEFNGRKLGYRSAFERDADFWEKEALPVLEPLIQKSFSFSSETDKRFAEQIHEELLQQEEAEQATETTIKE
jgi:RecA/RadA recombinase